VGFIFNFWIKRRNPAWWAKYNYVVSRHNKRFSETKDIDERWLGLWSRDLIDHYILDFEFTEWWD
jgi:hypothetical protein